MDIDSMQAGPEMNALIAEKIMGWERVEGAEAIAKLRGIPGNPDRWHSKRIWIEPGTKNMMACEECGDMRPFSTDIAAAWEVRKKMATLGWISKDDYTWIGWGEKDEEYGYSIWFKKWIGYRELCFHDHVRTTAEVPLCICRAALKAVEGKSAKQAFKEIGEIVEKFADKLMEGK